MKWIDLSAYGMKLIVVDLPSGGAFSRVLVMAKGDNHPEELKKLGFQTHAASGAWVMVANQPPTFAEIQKVFPNAERLENANPKDFYQNLAKKAAPAKGEGPAPKTADKKASTEADAKAPSDNTGSAEDNAAEDANTADADTSEAAEDNGDVSQEEEVALDVLLAQSKLLGLNRMGQEVYQNASGRFIKIKGKGREQDRATFEGEVEGIGPGLFLRAVDTNSLALAAEGFVEEMDRGRVLRMSDFSRFVSAVYDEEVEEKDERFVVANNAVQAAISRWLVRNDGKSTREIFSQAIKLHEAHPYVGDVMRRHKSASDTMPHPVSMAIQRLLGTSEELGGKKIVIAGSNATNLFTHLPKTVDLKVHIDSEDDRGNIRQTLSTLGRDQDTAVVGSADFTGAQMVVVDFERGLLSKPKVYGNFSVSRSDFAALLDSLETRDEQGRSVFVLKTDGSEEDEAEMEALRKHVARHYAVEGTVDIDGGLYSGHGDAEKTRIMVVGRRRPEALEAGPEPAMRKRDLNDFPTLWTWTSEVIANRAKIDSHFSMDPDALGSNDESELEENNFQAPYTALSNNGEASTMVPRNLEGATREALARLAKEHKDVDEWVASELAMTREQLQDAFSPEQVDAIALAMDAEDRGRAFLNADETGVGKGRFLAGLMRRAAMQGKKVLFLTEKSINLSDIMRDIRDTGSGNEFNTLILNSDTKIINEETGEIEMRAQPRDETMAIMETNEWPEEYNLIVGTYSQFNKLGEMPQRRRANGQDDEVQIHPKSRWLLNAIDEDTVIFVDECHNATSDTSNQGRNIKKALEAAGHVVYSSATFAAAPKNLPLFWRLFPADFETDNITEVVSKGGETLQETLSAMLVKDGVMIRREKDFSNCTFEMSVDHEHMDRNFQLMDTLAPIIAEMAYLSGDLDKRISAQNDRIERNLRRRMERENAARDFQIPVNDRAVSRRMKKLQMNRMGMGSPLSTITRLFNASLLVEKAAEEAIAALNNNQKPVIALESTIQGILQELSIGQDEVEGEVVPDFKDLMRRTLRQMTQASQIIDGERRMVSMIEPEPNMDAADAIIQHLMGIIPDDIMTPEGEGDPQFRERLHTLIDQAAAAVRDTVPEIEIEHFVEGTNTVHELINNMGDDHIVAARDIQGLSTKLPETPARAVKRIENMIAEFPDLEVSAIDAIRQRIEAAGYSCGEITGRSHEVRDGRITRRRAASKTEIKNAFNAGELDAVIINTAGATGIDLHAGRRKRDQRQRVFIEVQSIADIRKQIQAYGRVDRYDQVIGPIIKTLMTALPAEMRLVAMRNSKLRRMSANTTSNRDSSVLVDNIPDLINRVGDMVCTAYAEVRPDLMRRLGFDVDRNRKIEEQNADDEQANDGQDIKRSANGFLARLMMLPVEMQKQVINEIEADYRATLEELDAKGENPLKSKTIEGIVHHREKYVHDGADVENPTSEFHRPVFAQSVVIEKTVEPKRGEDIANEYEKALMAMGATTAQVYADRIERNRERILSQYKPHDAANVADALAQGHAHMIELDTRLTKLVETLGHLRPGAGINVTYDGVEDQGIVTRVHLPRQGYEHIPASYDVEYYIPGDSMPRFSSLGSLMKNTAFKLTDGLNGEDYDAILAQFDRALEGAALERRTILTGNDWQSMNLAISHKLGSMVNYEDADGVRRRGVLVSRKHLDLEFMPVPVRNADLAAALIMEDGAKIYGSSEMNSTGIVVERGKTGNIVMSLPSRRSRKHGFIYEHPPVQQMMQLLNVAEGNKNPKLVVEPRNLPTVMGHLIDAGARFFTNSKHREWTNEWMKKNYGDSPQEENAGETPRPAAAA